MLETCWYQRMVYISYCGWKGKQHGSNNISMESEEVQLYSHWYCFLLYTWILYLNKPFYVLGVMCSTALCKSWSPKYECPFVFLMHTKKTLKNTFAEFISMALRCYRPLKSCNISPEDASKTVNPWSRSDPTQTNRPSLEILQQVTILLRVADHWIKFDSF